LQQRRQIQGPREHREFARRRARPLRLRAIPIKFHAMADEYSDRFKHGTGMSREPAGWKACATPMGQRFFQSFIANWVAQTFLSAGSGDFSVARLKNATT